MSRSRPPGGTRRPLRVALLAYRGNPFSGGQGVYVSNLAAALTALGHDVELVAGPPYPDVPTGVSLTRLPSLDLYGEPDPFSFPGFGAFRDWIDVLEYGLMCTAAFPEPLTFSLRARRYLTAHADRFDIVHDNQSLGYGLVEPAGLPVVATVHHPVAIDRDLELARASWRRRLTLRRWYAFTRMQGRVARRLPSLITVSEASATDVVRELGVRRERLQVIPNGVAPELFRPRDEVRRVPGRIVTTASADVPLKGLVPLLEAVAKVRTERDAHLVVVGRLDPRGRAARTIRRLGLEDAVASRTGIDDPELAALLASAEVAVVPSLYEGFSLPAVEAMACETALVATTGGALPEVAGRDGETALLVEPGDADALALAIGRVLDDPGLRQRLAAAGRARVLANFTWRDAAAATAGVYREVLAGC